MTMNCWHSLNDHAKSYSRVVRDILSDAELIAIYLQIGTRGKTVVRFGARLLTEFGNLKALLDTHLNLFTQKPGLGSAKYVMLKAAVELGRRYCEEPLPQGELLSSSEATKRALASRLKEYTHEVFACLFWIIVYA